MSTFWQDYKPNREYETLITNLYIDNINNCKWLAKNVHRNLSSYLMEDGIPNLMEASTQFKIDGSTFNKLKSLTNQYLPCGTWEYYPLENESKVLYRWYAFKLIDEYFIQFKTYVERVK